MTRNAPGKFHRKGLSLVDLVRMFPDDETAKRWVEDIRWPDGPHCPHCESDNIQCNVAHKTMDYRCRTCRKWFSVRTNSIMQSSKLGYQVWVIAIYIMNTGLKGQSSMKLHRDLDITQKTAWHLAHRIREAWDDNGGSLFAGPVEADETYMGGFEKNKHARKKLNAGRGVVGKTAVAGVKDRPSNRVKAQVVEDTRARTLQGFVERNTAESATVYTDDALAYVGMARHHGSVKHSVGEYVRDMVHTNGIESFWSMLKRGHKGTYHKISSKHLNRYVAEFAGRHNVRNADTIDQMGGIVDGMKGKRLRYRDLIANNGLASGARN